VAFAFERADTYLTLVLPQPCCCSSPRLRSGVSSWGKLGDGGGVAHLPVQLGVRLPTGEFWDIRNLVAAKLNGAS
jgi:hypothetical protein